MASDPLHPGLGELGQRLQALGDPAEPLRLHPYQGGSVPVSAPERPVPPPPAPRPAPQPAPQSAYNAWQAIPPAPAPPEPFLEATIPYSSTNGYTQIPGAASSTPPASTPASAGPAAPPNPADPAMPSGLQRAINAVRQTIPLVQRLLPLLEGNIATAATAITALVAPHPTVQHIHPPAPAPPPAPVPIKIDLEPVERGLAEVRDSHRELRTQFGEHVTALKRVEDQLDHVREATDRNTLEQQELVEDLRAVGGRLSTFALIGLILLALSLLLNGYLIFEMQRILH